MNPLHLYYKCSLGGNEICEVQMRFFYCTLEQILTLQTCDTDAVLLFAALTCLLKELSLPLVQRVHSHLHDAPTG